MKKTKGTHTQASEEEYCKPKVDLFVTTLKLKDNGINYTPHFTQENFRRKVAQTKYAPTKLTYTTSTSLRPPCEPERGSSNSSERAANSNELNQMTTPSFYEHF